MDEECQPFIRIALFKAIFSNNFIYELQLIAMRTTMLASHFRNYGNPEVLELKTVAVPEVKATSILIEVHCSTVNRTDSGFLTGKPWIARLFSGVLRPRFNVLGNEFAGVVVKVGCDVKQFQVGDRVFGFDADDFGGHAEFIAVDEKSPVARIPAGLEFQDVVASTEGGHYALNYIRAAKISGGQRVLVNGATGAIGSAAVQILKSMGVYVTAVCAGEYIEKVRSLGADEVIDYQKEDFTRLPGGYDMVFDAVGKSSFRACLPLVKKRGFYVSTELGYLSQNPFLALLTPLFGGKRLLFPIPSINQDDVVYFQGLLATRQFRPLIDRSYPLTDVSAAFEYVLTGMKVGNVLIEMPAMTKAREGFKLRDVNAPQPLAAD